MRTMISLSLLGLVALLGACDAVTDPVAEPAISAARGGRYAATELTSSGTTSTASTDQTDPTPGELTGLRLASWAPPLETYDTTFIAVQGRPSTHALYFQKQPWELYPVKYMELDIPAGAEFVDADGNPVPKGTVVPITVHADSGVVRFEFGPHGSSFSTKKPATLSVWWLYCDMGSLWAGGLQVWYQPDSTESWSALDTQIDMVGAYLTAPIYHFSNYAVAW